MQDDNQKQDPPAKTLANLRQPQSLAVTDQKIDMFSAGGFALAQRIANAFATSDAVPAIFQALVPKKDKGVIVDWLENKSAFGNCLVAIETAQAVGMSITAVMQNANIIEGKLSWAGQFKIAAVNASKRFTVLRYDIKNKGMMKAKYKEKDGWNKEKGKFNMIEHEITIENLECIAWALPYGTEFPRGVVTMDKAKVAGLPVIEGPPVSIKLAVEEGWYAKPGSKWQTEMKHKMLTIRAGAYFSDIHAPDVVMGMGRTSEELDDMSTIDVERQPNGQYAAAGLDELRAASRPAEAKHANAETVEVRENKPEDHTPPDAEVPADAVKPANKDHVEPAAAAQPAREQMTPEASKEYERVAAVIHKALTLNQLADAADMIDGVDHENLRKELKAMHRARLAELQAPAAAAPAKEEAPAPAKRTRRAASAPE